MTSIQPTPSIHPQNVKPTATTSSTTRFDLSNTEIYTARTPHKVKKSLPPNLYSHPHTTMADNKDEPINISGRDEAYFIKSGGKQITRIPVSALSTEAVNLKFDGNYEDYATVKVNGVIVAKVSNGGLGCISDDIGWDIWSQLPMDVEGESGPVLAQARANVIANFLGGEVVLLDTAITQDEYNAKFFEDADPDIIFNDKKPPPLSLLLSSHINHNK